jgi:hypothetical protein
MATRDTGSRDEPFYIVGLPEEPIEAEAAKSKFQRLTEEISRAFPFVEEVRAVVKSKEPKRGRGRYEVSVEVYTPKQRYAFAEEGYDIAAVFDSMGPKMKRILSSKPSRVTKSHGESLRRAGLAKP